MRTRLAALAIIGAMLGMMLLAGGCSPATPESSDVSTTPEAAPTDDPTSAPTDAAGDAPAGPTIGELITLEEIGQILGREGVFFVCYS